MVTAFGKWRNGVLLAALVAVPVVVAHAPLRAETLGDFILRKLHSLPLPQRVVRQGPVSRPASTPARAATVPVPRPRPWRQVGVPAISGLAASAPSAPAVPLPRARPAVLDRQAADTMAPAAVRTDAAGRVVVDPGRMVKERDHRRAVYLQPREVGHWDAATVKAARSNCELVLAALNVDAEPASPIGGPEGCGIAAPVVVRALGPARMKPAAKLNCRFTAALYEWMRDVVQPAARRHFGQPVVAIRQLSHYACRRRGGVSRGPVRISEHSFGNAIDIGQFWLADGTRISLLKDWGELSAIFNRKSAFLAEVRKGACKYFSTVLSPKYNKAHANHFHFDLGRGGRYKICK